MRSLMLQALEEGEIGRRFRLGAPTVKCLTEESCVL